MTVRKDKKPREFWVSEHSGGATIDWDGPPNYLPEYFIWNKLYHVIEKSAYDAQAAEIESLRAELKLQDQANDILTRNCDELKSANKLRTENKILREALKGAQDTICGEFCGSDRHHPLCDEPRKALSEVAKLAERKDEK